jgi:hypothetical protein
MVTLNCFPRVSSWQSRFLSTAMVGIASASALLAASPTLGDPARPIVNEKFSDFAPAIAELRQEVGQDRRSIVRANMLLTETESARFWSLTNIVPRGRKSGTVVCGCSLTSWRRKTQ